MRIGIIMEGNEFYEAQKPACLLSIDFGEPIGVKNSSAQILNYRVNELIGRKVIAVVNLKIMPIPNSTSEVLAMGALTKNSVQPLSVDGSTEPVIDAKIG